MLRMSAQQQEPRENIMSNAQVVRNPVGRQYKGRRYADRYAAGLQQSWGGAQSDGSTVEIVVDTLETPEGRRFQVMAVTTPAPVQETQEPKRVTDENIKEIGRASCRGKSVSVRVDLGGRRIIKNKIRENSKKLPTQKTKD